MDPLSIMALAGLAGQIGGGLLSLFGQNKQADEEQRRLLLQAGYADELARFTRDQGSYAAGRLRVSGSEQEAEIEQQQALSGLNPDVGTSALNRAHVQTIAELDAKMAMNNAARTARGYANQASTLRSQARSVAEGQKLRNIAGGIGLAAGVAGGVYGLSQEFDIFGGGGLPATSAMDRTLEASDRAFATFDETYGQPRRFRTSRDALYWLE